MDDPQELSYRADFETPLSDLAYLGRTQDEPSGPERPSPWWLWPALLFAVLFAVAMVIAVW